MPNLVHKISILQSTDAKFVLVVEKDATFQHLLESKALEKLGPCIIITVSRTCVVTELNVVIDEINPKNN